MPIGARPPHSAVWFCRIAACAALSNVSMSPPGVGRSVGILVMAYLLWHISHDILLMAYIVMAACVGRWVGVDDISVMTYYL